MYPVEFNEYTHKNTDTYSQIQEEAFRYHFIRLSMKKFNLGLNLYIKSKILNIDDVFLTTPILPGFSDYWAGHNTGYSSIDGSIGYKISNIFTLSLAVKNITNTEYMGRPGDIQPPRNFSLRFSGKI